MFDTDKKYFSNSKTLCNYHKLLKPTYGLFQLDKMTQESLHLARTYVNTVKFAVTNLFYVNFFGVVDGNQWPPQTSCEAFTMLGLRRLDNIQLLLEDVIQRNVKGDFIETGVWKGGACIFAASIFKAYQQYDRRVFLADSFDGIPPVNTGMFPVDKSHAGSENLGILKGNHSGGLEGVKNRMNLFFNVHTVKNYKSSANGLDLSLMNGVDELEHSEDLR